MSYTTFAKLRYNYKTRKRFMTISYNINSNILTMSDTHFFQREYISRNGIRHKYNSLYGKSYPVYMHGRNENESIRDNCNIDCYYTLRDFIRS